MKDPAVVHVKGSWSVSGQRHASERRGGAPRSNVAVGTQSTFVASRARPHGRATFLIVPDELRITSLHPIEAESKCADAAPTLKAGRRPAFKNPKTMNRMNRNCLPLVFAWLDLVLVASSAPAQVFTIQVGSPPTPLVPHGDVWHYHKGTNAPQASWQSIAEGALDATWATGNGGFGYADNASETQKVKTVLFDMRSATAGGAPTNYSTVYIRHSFEITDAIDPAQHLILTVDFDDAFVAYLDGVEVARSNVVGTVNVGSLALGSHESSQGNTAPLFAPLINDLGAVGSRLPVGTHVLALIGVNAATNSSDLILVPDLALGAPGTVINGQFLSIVRSNSVLLSGTNSLAGSAKVLVDGAEAAFNTDNGSWSNTVSLAPGFNRLLLQAIDASGVPIYSTNQVIVSDTSSSFVGGPISGNVTWQSAMGIIHVTNTVAVLPGASLTLEPGVVCLFSVGSSLLATNASLIAMGTEDAPVYFAPADGTTVWGELAASGTSGELRLQHAETAAGHIELFDGAVGTLEDSYFHDYEVSSPAIIHTLGQPNHVTLNLRRCHVRDYYEILSQLATNHIEECLCEYQAAGGDGIDFDAAQRGSYIRRCTVRHSKFTNVDALDMGEYGGTGEGSHGVFIDSCLLYDFADKGVSMGVAVEVGVSNCLIYGCNSGVAVKDNSVAGIFNSTIVSNNFGLNCYNKANPASSTGGGFITNSYNNIVWSSTTATIVLSNGSTLEATYTDFENTNYPSAGNISADPLFENPALRDYRLKPASPCLGTGRDGATLGCTYPVGAAMALSHPRIESIERIPDGAVLHFWADNERSYSLLTSDHVSGGSWAKVTDIFPTSVPRLVSLTNSTPNQARYYRLVSPAQ